MSEKYNHKDWLAEMEAPRVKLMFNDSRGGMDYHARKLPCPKCEAVGFYGPFASDNDPEYRMCKFCGIWQKVGGDLERCNMFYHHDCKEAEKHPDPIKEILKYDWNKGGKECAHSLCKVVTNRIVDWPTENQSHPFHILKNEAQVVEMIYMPLLGKNP